MQSAYKEKDRDATPTAGDILEGAAPLTTQKTKLVCTIGPASSSKAIIKQMILAGMNVARLNFSHGDFSGHQEVIQNLLEAQHEIGHRIAIMADLPGPKMRIGRLGREPIQLIAGAPFILTTEDIIGDETRVSTTFSSLPKTVKPGDVVFLDDGLIQLEVILIAGKDVQCRVRVGGELRSRKGLNLPGISLGVSAFTEHDYKCLKFSLENGVDAVSQSFVEKPEDIQAVRDAAASLGYSPLVIAKIERSEALGSIEKIIDVSDGILIVRGDLGVELPIEQIALIQKRLIHLANMRAKPVITATQMLESMISHLRPTRAEATDVANAILDGTDCLMLSGESAVGSHPVEAVATLARIAMAIEPCREPVRPEKMFSDIDLKDMVPGTKLVDLAVETVLNYTSRALVFVPTRDGHRARSIARFRLGTWIIAVCSHEAICRHLQFSFGVHAVFEPETPGKWSEYSRDWVKARAPTVGFALLAQDSNDVDCDHGLEIIEIRQLPPTC